MQSSIENYVESQNCFVAFIDILGFKKFVEKESSEKVYRRLSEFVNRPTELISTLDPKTDMFKDLIDIKIFSDSIILSTPIPDDKNDITSVFQRFVSYLNALQLVYLTQNWFEPLPIRAAIVEGEFFYSKNIIFGKGLIKAFEAESKLANYPRIIIKTDKEYMFPEQHTDKSGQSRVLPEYKDGVPQFLSVYTHPLKRDFDGLLFCNYLSMLLSYSDENTQYVCNIMKKHMDFINKSLGESSREPSVAMKYHWCKTYHNWFCEGNDIFHQFVI